jgi:hypothetical protein
MSYHVLKKRKKTPKTCNHALRPPLGIDETLLTDAFVLFFTTFPPSKPSSACAAASTRIPGANAHPWQPPNQKCHLHEKH